LPSGGYPLNTARKPPPKKFWYIFAAVLIVVGIAVSAVGITNIANSFGQLPSAEHTFTSGGSTTVHVEADQKMLIYIENTSASGRRHIDCASTGGASGGVQLQRYQDSLSLNEWDAAFTLTAGTSGDYTVTCTGAPNDTFGIGEDPGVGDMFGAVLASIAGMLPVIVGLSVLTVCLWLRRRRRRA
jgi:hypothetical protein